jgi:hypothetical protein
MQNEQFEHQHFANAMDNERLSSKIMWEMAASSFKMLQMENGQNNKSKQETQNGRTTISQTLPAPLQSGGTWCNIPNQRDVRCKYVFSLLSHSQHRSWCQGDPWFNDLQYRILR